jgi:hypothetical protein
MEMENSILSLKRLMDFFDDDTIFWPQDIFLSNLEQKLHSIQYII